MFKTILWATDGSANADRALPYAKELARGEAGKLVAVHCREVYPGSRSAGYPVAPGDDGLVEKIEAQVADLQTEGIEAAVEIVRSGSNSVANMIADTARYVGADVIVVGTRGHAPVMGLLVGGVTQRLLHVAPCPVLAIPVATVAAATHSEPEQIVAAG